MEASAQLSRRDHGHEVVSLSFHLAASAKRKVHTVMKERKQGTLKSGSGKKLRSRKQAVAIALSEARKSGAKVPKKKET